ncbi:MAG: ATP-binding protein [Sandaracinaceae bacterium]|nr:ATP-binding protein [Sandaracinaceae bacterium]MDW8244990.1 hypothetical protein [Sandaracinaceae bacterium]
MQFILIGPHGVGKTTLGRILHQEMGWLFHDEIGKILSEDRRWRPMGVGPFDPQEAFDREVFRQELERDQLFRQNRGVMRIVETWHFGNYAFASKRLPKLAETMWQEVEQRTDFSDVVVIPLEASRDALEQRKSYDEPVDTFIEVARVALEKASSLGVQITSPIRNDYDSPLNAAMRLKDIILSQLWRVRR